MIKQITAQQIEERLGAKDSQTLGVYVGYQQIIDCIGPTKIGRTVNVRAIARGRSQGGADWWFHSFWPLADRAETYIVEKQLKKMLHSYKIKGTQTQTELYSLTPAQAEKHISEVLGESIV